MKKDIEKTEVQFLIEKDGEDVFAFFPKERFNHWDINMFGSYAHIGQHSACHIDYAKECKEATKEQYLELEKELESIGYNLLITNKN